MRGSTETMGSTARLLDRFEGNWSIDRHIFDVDSQWLGRFRGEGIFTPREGGLDYAEEGRLQFAGLTSIRATRKYRWDEAGGIICVTFEDGSPFHRFDPAEERTRASYYCDPDEYDVTYDFRRWPEWRAEWRVEGPRKDYRMVSIFRRPWMTPEPDWEPDEYPRPLRDDPPMPEGWEHY